MTGEPAAAEPPVEGTPSPSRLGVAIAGCGRIGVKRAKALTADEELVACYDLDAGATRSLAGRYGARACSSMQELLRCRPQVVVVATVHDCLAELAEQALRAGAHVLVEKPAGLSSAQVVI